jgi:hypothetical protein
MPPLEFPKYEAFATALASGAEPEIAAQVAGLGSRNAAAKLMAGPFGLAINMRVAEIKGEHPQIAEESDDAPVEEMDRRWVLTQLRKTYKAAKESEQYKPALEALRLIGVENGMFVQRRELTLKKIDEMSTEELRKLADDLEVEFTDVTDQVSLPAPAGFSEE